MKATVPARLAFVFSSAALALATATVIFATPASAAVEYVKVCSLYGAGYEYLPGTDVCVNFATGDAREQTAGGTWEWRMPNNPRTWVSSAQGACHGGKLTKLGDFTGSNLTLDSYSRYETAPTALKLKPGQYIGSVLYQGGFTGTGVDGNFCLFYNWNDPSNGNSYAPIGCEDTAATAGAPPTLQFTPDNPLPPQTTAKMNVLGANGDSWSATSNADIQGTLSIWVCIQSAHVTKPKHPAP